MKQYKGPDGKPRIWFEPLEIEYIMEDELAEAGLYPTPEQPMVDIEKLLEGRLGVKLDQYANLEETVLGLTIFAPGEKPKVEINRDLTGAVFDQEDGGLGLLGRWRATLAHEAAHVILHRILFELPLAQGSLFGQSRSEVQMQPSLMRCLKRDVGFASRQADWREVQANKGMASLLMPQRLVVQVARQGLPAELGTSPEQGSLEAQLLVSRVSDLFQVSRQAATIRLDDLGIVIRGGQRQLGRP